MGTGRVKSQTQLVHDVLHQKLSPLAELRDLVELVVEDTPQYDPNVDELQNAKTFLMFEEEPEVTPEWGNLYVNAKVLLLRGYKLPEAKWYSGSMMLMVMQLVDPIRTPF